MAPRADARAVPRPAAEGHRTRFHRPPVERSRAWTVPLRGLRRGALPCRGEVRERQRLAELHAARRSARRRVGARSEPRDAPARGALPPLRRTSRPRLPGRTASYRRALLHQLGVAQEGALTQLAARSRRSFRSRAFLVSEAARSNSARASSNRPSLTSRSPRTLGSR